jgi:hypothetical protein
MCCEEGLELKKKVEVWFLRLLIEEVRKGCDLLMWLNCVVV